MLKIPHIWRILPYAWTICAVWVMFGVWHYVEKGQVLSAWWHFPYWITASLVWLAALCLLIVKDIKETTKG